jgi:hypothetical protein
VIFDEPTRGVDAGAIVEIHRFINELASRPTCRKSWRSRIASWSRGGDAS